MGKRKVLNESQLKEIRLPEHNDMVIIAPWDFKPTERGDIVWRFTLGQVDWLRNNGHLQKDF